MIQSRKEQSRASTGGCFDGYGVMKAVARKVSNHSCGMSHGKRCIALWLAQKAGKCLAPLARILQSIFPRLDKPVPFGAI